ncbi:zinc-dependent peptidase [Nonlabens sp. Ci31]|jgi:Mlc titration factor MtfA (ptsG expression regulator)|uniref:zinc-dependent peptidase n=1 Tax=Nonlabens sp. Ci31 TaxID=2608253 RepID=UPI001463F465|nr:zinc-dependent peptidase [Nonlabens sp. Ci31]QJP34810.1 zinc-dependent peptidase [Nonlabens sp. Ci31]
MAPYAFAVVGFGFLSIFAHLILRGLQRKRDFLWYRQALSYRRLPISRKRVLETYPFYKQLSYKYKKQFEHRVAAFIVDKDFRNRYEGAVTDQQVVLISCVACRLSFGRRSYLYPMLNTVLLFPEAFMSPANKALHKGEFNPLAKVLAISWKDFKEGMDITNDNLHLGLHEFTHVMHFESDRSNDIDAVRFKKYTNKILRELMKPEVRSKLDQTQFFRAYAFINQYEFMAVLSEYFFESNADFKKAFPIIYGHLIKALLYKEEWILR